MLSYIGLQKPRQIEEKGKQKSCSSSLNDEIMSCPLRTNLYLAFAFHEITSSFSFCVSVFSLSVILQVATYCVHVPLVAGLENFVACKQCFNLVGITV